MSHVTCVCTNFVYSVDKFFLESFVVYSSVIHNRFKVPWKAVFTSIPVWAAVLSNFASSVGTYTIAMYLPLYLHQVHHISLLTVGSFTRTEK